VRVRVRVLAAVALCLCVGCGAGASQPATGTKLVPQPLHGNQWLLPGGGVVTDGAEILQVPEGAPPVTITDVRLVGARDVRFVGARLSDPHRKTYQFYGAPRFPSSEGRSSIPAIGATITDAKRGWELLVGLDVGSSDYPLIEGIEVRYSLGGQDYRQVFRGSAIFCAEEPARRGTQCRPPASLLKLVGHG
jgi:hypothetical protein